MFLVVPATLTLDLTLLITSIFILWSASFLDIHPATKVTNVLQVATNGRIYISQDVLFNEVRFPYSHLFPFAHINPVPSFQSNKPNSMSLLHLPRLIQLNQPNHKCPTHLPIPQPKCLYLNLLILPRHFNILQHNYPTDFLPTLQHNHLILHLQINVLWNIHHLVLLILHPCLHHTPEILTILPSPQLTHKIMMPHLIPNQHLLLNLCLYLSFI